MFAYAIKTGVSLGLLDGGEFAGIPERAFRALARLVGADGRLVGVCAGTGKSADRTYYLGRPRVAGDLHGQAAMLWLCAAMLEESLPPQPGRAGKPTTFGVHRQFVLARSLATNDEVSLKATIPIA